MKVIIYFVDTYIKIELITNIKIKNGREKLSV